MKALFLYLDSFLFYLIYFPLNRRMHVFSVYLVQFAWLQATLHIHIEARFSFHVEAWLALQFLLCMFFLVSILTSKDMQFIFLFIVHIEPFFC